MKDVAIYFKSGNMTIINCSDVVLRYGPFGNLIGVQMIYSNEGNEAYVDPEQIECISVRNSDILNDWDDDIGKQERMADSL